MKLRLILSLAGLSIVVVSAAQLFASPAVSDASMCCGGPADCPKATQCCDPSAVGRADCAPDAPGWCFAECKIIVEPK